MMGLSPLTGRSLTMSPPLTLALRPLAPSPPVPLFKPVPRPFLAFLFTMQPCLKSRLTPLTKLAPRLGRDCGVQPATNGSNPKPPKATLKNILDCVNRTRPLLSTASSLRSRWQHWHARAELALHEAAKAGLATQLISPERSKGSLPTRACNPGPVCRGPQTHLHRRLLRLHRAVAECLRQGTPAQAALPPPLQRRVCAVLHLEDDSIRTALQCLNNAISAQVTRAQVCRSSGERMASKFCTPCHRQLVRCQSSA